MMRDTCYGSGNPRISRIKHHATCSFKRLVKRAGLPQTMTLHDVRHCAARFMLARGENMEAVTEVLGHASRSITERTYAHALPENKQKAGESLGYLLNIKKEKGT